MNEIDWNQLKLLRQSYLNAQGNLPDYWKSEALLDAYEATLGARIAWKWDAVLSVLAAQKWKAPEGAQLLDWGCGTGVASRRFIASGLFGGKRVSCYDRSPRAGAHAKKQLLKERPDLEIDHQLPRPGTPYILLLSHVLSELSALERDKLIALGRGAAAVIWVEAGRRQESRLLSSVRDAWSETHQILAPCPHQGPCGMLRSEQEENWCHFFAPVPSAVFQSAFWRQASRELGIDLRSLPLSYLIADQRREQRAGEENFLRVLGRGRAYKGYCRWSACGSQGIVEGNYLKRRSRSTYEQLSSPGLELIVDAQQLQE